MKAIKLDEKTKKRLKAIKDLVKTILIIWFLVWGFMLIKDMVRASQAKAEGDRVVNISELGFRPELFGHDGEI